MEKFTASGLMPEQHFHLKFKQPRNLPTWADDIECSSSLDSAFVGFCLKGKIPNKGNCIRVDRSVVDQNQ